MQKYRKHVELILNYLDKNNYCSSLIQANRRCFRELEVHLLKEGVSYTPQIADKWYISDDARISKTDKHHFNVALIRLQDVYETGSIRMEHETRHLMSYTVLIPSWKIILDEYIFSMKGQRADATLENYRHSCSRFFLFMQKKGINAISDITYALIMRFYKEDKHQGRWGKGQIDGQLTIMMDHFYQKGIVSYGFTIILHYLTFHKECFWNDICQEVHDSVERIMVSAATVPVDKLHEYQLVSEKIHYENEYSKSVRSTFRKAVDLLILFLDFNGYQYNPDIAMIWYDSVHNFFCREASSIRRSLCLLAQYNDSSIMRIDTVFRNKPNAFALIPEWCKDAANRYVETKIMEGWALSTLNMIRSSICRFCNYLNQSGIRSFMEIEVSHIKQFNIYDIHKTAAGKNAYNVRIRKFLLYLGLNGYLDNPMLFVSLNCASAPKETIVVVLSEAETAHLNTEISNEQSALSLRKKAMLLLGLKMGLRSSDIVNLKLDNINWNAASIRFIQEKTAVEVDLPMPTEVGNAIFRYIMEERHKKQSLPIFLSEKAPYNPVGRTACHKALDAALPDRDVPGSGFHVTRKTYATNLLRNGVGAGLVADALGQRGTASVHRYLSLDSDRMRMCALSLKDCGIGGWNNGR